MYTKTVFICLMTIALSCNKKKDDVLHQVFNEKEMETVERILSFYDEYVWSQTDRSLPIDKAYRTFMYTNCTLAADSDRWNFIPPKDAKLKLFNSLDKKSLNSLYITIDSFQVYNRNTKETRVVYPSYFFELNLTGKYVELLRLLSSRNAFFKAYYERTLYVGEVAPTTISAILHSYHTEESMKKDLSVRADFDFSRRDERFVCAATFLFINDWSEIMDVTCERTVRW